MLKASVVEETPDISEDSRLRVLWVGASVEHQKFAQKYFEASSLTKIDLEYHRDLRTFEQRLGEGGFECVLFDGEDWEIAKEALDIAIRVSPFSVRVLWADGSCESPTKLIELAHRLVLNTDSTDGVLEELEQVRRFVAQYSKSGAKTLIGASNRLPCRPSIYTKIVSILADRKGSLFAVASAVERDVAISAQVLRVVNQTRFFRGVKVWSVQQAVPRLGAAMIRDIVLSLELPRAFQGLTADFCDEVTEHSHRVAILARAIAVAKDAKGLAFTTAILHDVGRLFLRANHSGKEKSLETQVAAGASVFEAEIEVLGCRRAEVGAFLMGLWGLPLEVVNGINFWEDVEHINYDAEAWACVHIAHTLLDAKLHGSVRQADVVRFKKLRSLGYSKSISNAQRYFGDSSQ